MKENPRSGPATLVCKISGSLGLPEEVGAGLGLGTEPETMLDLGLNDIELFIGSENYIL